MAPQPQVDGRRGSCKAFNYKRHETSVFLSCKNTSKKSPVYLNLTFRPGNAPVENKQLNYIKAHCEPKKASKTAGTNKQILPAELSCWSTYCTLLHKLIPRNNSNIPGGQVTIMAWVLITAFDPVRSKFICEVCVCLCPGVLNCLWWRTTRRTSLYYLPTSFLTRGCKYS